MMKLLCRTLMAASLGLAWLPGFAASADELIQACEKLKRADDRATCLREAVKAVAASQVPAPAAAKAPNPQELVLSAAENVMKALRRLSSATAVGITLHDYSQLVVTESANIDESLRSIRDGQFKDSALKSRQAYIDAREVWSASIRWRYVSTFRSAALPILRRYAIDTMRLESLRDDATITDMPIAYFLSPIWSAASREIAATSAAMPSLMEPQQPALAPPSSSIADQSSVVDEQSKPPIVRRKATAEDQRVLLALRRLDATADTGPGLNEYAKLSTAGVAEVDAALSNIPNDAFRTKVLAARQAYVDAHQVWYWAEQYQYLSQFADAAGPTLRTYGVGPGTMNSTGIKEMRLMPRHIFLFPIWSAARIHIDAAEALLSSPEAAKPMPNKLEAPADVDSSRSAAALRKAEEIRKAEELRKATGQGKTADQGKADAQPNKQAP